VDQEVYLPDVVAAHGREVDHLEGAILHPFHQELRLQLQEGAFWLRVAGLDVLDELEGEVENVQKVG